MTWRIVITPIAKKQISRLDTATQRRVLLRIKDIQSDPFRFIQRLANQPVYKSRVGKYRIIIKIEDDKLIITIIKVLKRSRVYANL